MSVKKFLVVDDSPTMRRIIINSLNKIGVNNIIDAENGVDALEKLETVQVDIILTDWNMPEMNGKELVETLRKDPRFKTTPILMITTRGLQEDVITALRSGVNGYVVKPFTPDILKEKLAKFL